MSIVSKLINLSIIIIFVSMLVIILSFAPIDMSESDANEFNESKVIELTYDKLNEERTREGLTNLDSSNEIEIVAEYKTTNMIEQDYISHTSPSGEDVRTRFDKHDVRCEVVGENLAKTFYDKKVNTEDGTAVYKSMEELSSGIVTQFMNSPEHKDNLLDENWNIHGLNIQINENEVYVTHKFCSI